MKLDLKSMTREEIGVWLQEAGLPRYRADQIFRWLHRGAVSFEEMTNLPASLRKKIEEKCYISVATIEKKQVSHYDKTIKYLLCMPDGERVECVSMQYHHGKTLCLSSQVGCRMGCVFCATGQSGFARNLTASEMIAQIQAVEADTGERSSNVVLMGMGEPLDNYENVLRFLRLVSDENGLCIGMRHLSLSTCGVVDKIYKLAEEKLQLTLSVSLHAPDDETRSRMMPINRKWNVGALLKACQYYSDTTRRRISFEYALVRDVNDSDSCARLLAKKLKGIRSHVNLIPVNETGAPGYQKSEKTRSFYTILEQCGIAVSVRRTLGGDIDAACGQLRRRVIGEESCNANL